MIKVIDDFLPARYHLEIKGLLSSNEFDWHLVPNMSSKYEAEQHIQNVTGYGFFHTFYDDLSQFWTGYYNFIKPFTYHVMEETNTNRLLRTRADMVTYKGPAGHVYDDHVDYPEKDFLHNKSCVYYVNDSDGDTIIYKERFDEWRDDNKHTVDQSVTPKANRIVIFDGDLIHTGSSPIENPFRIIINSNFI